MTTARICPLRTVNIDIEEGECCFNPWRRRKGKGDKGEETEGEKG